MASSASDRTVNKIAICSAIFAGVAYVGYSYVKNAFSRGFKKYKNGDDGSSFDVSIPRSNGRVYLRRLSGSEASASAELLLGSLESEQPPRLILRPLTVQQRIKELNLRARHFAETVLAVQLHESGVRSGQQRALQGHTKSLGASPTATPMHIMSPIDIPHLGSSRYTSVEDLTAANGDDVPPQRVRSRRRIRSPDSGTFSREDEVEAEAERLLDEREAELRKRLQGFEDGTTKVLTPYEAKSLVALLHAKDCETLEKALVTISNSAAFTQNQDNLREAGCLLRLHHLVLNQDRNVRLAAVTAVGNMALNTSNQKEMEHIVPLLLPVVESESLNDDHMLYQTLLTLTNIAALCDWHQQFSIALPRFLELSHSFNSKIKMQSLRLLINLSTNERMVPPLMAAKAPEEMWSLLDESHPEDQLLRILTLLANLVSTIHMQKMKLDLPLDDGDSVRYTQLYGVDHREEVMDYLRSLMTSHNHEDIRVKARLVHNALKMEAEDQEKRNEMRSLR